MILEYLKEKKIVIYGTGYVAHKYYDVLLKHGMDKQIQCFVKTGKVCADEQFEGFPVYRFEDVGIDNETIICLAVHESIQDELEKAVRKVTKQYLWIYPYLYELMFGIPEQKNIELSIESLRGNFKKDLRLSVRLAAIEEFYGLNTYGFDYYIKAQMLHCSRSTAEQRLKRFQQLISNWEISGYESNKTIALNRKYEVIDGNHRLALAIYKRQKIIYGDIYPTDLSVEKIHGSKAILSKNTLLIYGFNKNDIQRLEEIQRKY